MGGVPGSASERAMADEFVDYFSTVGENLAVAVGKPVINDAQHTVYSVFSLLTVIELELFGHVDGFCGV